MNRRAFLLASAALLVVPNDADARAGGGHNYRSSSRSSSSRSSSSRSSSSRSSSSRSTWSPSSSGSSGRTYSGGGSSHSSEGEFLFLVIFGFVVVGFMLVHALNEMKEQHTWSDDLDDDELLPPARQINTAPRLAALQAADPDFDLAAFLGHVEEAFQAIQAHWSVQNMAPARRFISDGVFNRFETYLDLDRMQGRRNVVSGVEILNREVSAVSQVGDYDSVTVRITAALNDKTFSTKDGKILHNKDDLFTEHWSFLRRKGVASRAGGFTDDGCPSCGAPLDINQTAKCTHCSALVNSGEYDWVLAEISQNIPHVTSEATAPGVALQLLEDRASVAIWSLIDAALRGQPERARRLVSPEVYSEMTRAKASGRWWAVTDVGIGAIRTVGYRQVADTEIAVLELDWSGTRVERPAPKDRNPVGRTFEAVHQISMRRTAGASSVPRGLATAGCGSCGGPLDRTIQGSCPWCQAPLVASPGDWVLSEAPRIVFRPAVD